MPSGIFSRIFVTLTVTFLIEINWQSLINIFFTLNYFFGISVSNFTLQISLHVLLPLNLGQLLY